MITIQFTHLWREVQVLTPEYLPQQSIFLPLFNAQDWESSLGLDTRILISLLPFFPSQQETLHLIQSFNREIAFGGSWPWIVHHKRAPFHNFPKTDICCSRPILFNASLSPRIQLQTNLCIFCIRMIIVSLLHESPFSSLRCRIF